MLCVVWASRNFFRETNRTNRLTYLLYVCMGYLNAPMHSSCTVCIVNTHHCCQMLRETKTTRALTMNVGLVRMYMHYITSHSTTLHHITLHCITLQYMSFHAISFRYIMSLRHTAASQPPKQVLLSSSCPSATTNGA